jgi:hypothetical protein
MLKNGQIIQLVFFIFVSIFFVGCKKLAIEPTPGECLQFCEKEICKDERGGVSILHCGHVVRCGCKDGSDFTFWKINE